MFKCEFSGEISDGPVKAVVRDLNKTADGAEVKGLTQSYVEKAAERPMKVVVESRKVTYQNYGFDDDGNRVRLPDTYGVETIKEITIRAKHLDAVKKKYNL